jgi:outer membrane protein assembly factor BamA
MHRTWLPLLLGALLGLGNLASAAGSSVAHAATIPNDAQLEAAKATIGTITIRSLEIFDPNDPNDNKLLFRLADRLHINTRESAIRAQLLFRTGERYSRSKIAETERNLRQLDFIREPAIRPIAYHDGVVDLEIVTHDVWTLQPGISFSRSGGTNSTGLNLQDSNLLGYGKSIALGRSTNVDRTSTYAQWDDPNVWGSRWTDDIRYSKNNDGKLLSAAIEYPFYALDTRYSGGIAASDNLSIVQRYRLGRPYDSYRSDDKWSDLHFGGSFGDSDRWTKRYLLGFRHDNNQFSPAPDAAPLAPLPLDRNLAYPFLRLQWIEDTYTTMQNLDLIARTEDLHLGLLASVGLGWATPTFGADRDAWIADAQADYGLRFGPQHQLFFGGRLGGRLEHGDLRDGLASAHGAYYVATSDRTRLVARFSADAGRNLDIDHYPELGGDFGLRGYPLRYQSGTDRALMTVEERLYTHWNLFRLLDVGGAAFFDAGRTWGTAPVGTPQLGLLKDLGIGLRLGNARSSFGNVIHIDLAAPLNGDASISKLQLVVNTEQTY